MKTTLRRLLALTFTVLVLSAAHAQPATPAEDPRHEELRALKTTYETALSSGDLTPLAAALRRRQQRRHGRTTNHSAPSPNSRPSTTASTPISPASFTASNSTPSPASSPATSPSRTAPAEEFVKTSAAEFTYTSTWTVVLRRLRRRLETRPLASHDGPLPQQHRHLPSKRNRCSPTASPPSPPASP